MKVLRIIILVILLNLMAFGGNWKLAANLKVSDWDMGSNWQVLNASPALGLEWTHWKSLPIGFFISPSIENIDGKNRSRLNLTFPHTDLIGRLGIGLETRFWDARETGGLVAFVDSKLILTYRLK